ncbi:MAG: type II toxin-antitoxin system YafQ family toxin [Erysipelotrichaceae bacterium]|nr:type II toxin-antitoxin system YafQ family toxin [Erysipelotrichaceae bacterium]
MNEIVITGTFQKDLKTIKKRGLPINELKAVIETLSLEKKLDSKYHDHRLQGEYHRFRECHIRPDWLLIYSIDTKSSQLYLIRTGSHSDLYR